MEHALAQAGPRIKGLWGGGDIVEYEDLDKIPTPEETETYVPVLHKDFVYNVSKYADEILEPKGFKRQEQQNIIVKDGQRLFGVLSLQNGHDGMQLAVGYRNSYDKSMKAGVCIGAKVVVCSNLMLSGDIVVMRKHTGDVLKYLHDHLILAFYKAADTWTDLTLAVDQMKRVHLDQDQAHGLLGRAAVKKVIAPSEVLNIAKVWHKHKYDYGEDTLYRWYNCVTERLRATPPHQIMQRHRGLHDFVTTTNEFKTSAPF